jgi:hypothetical protein
MSGDAHEFILLNVGFVSELVILNAGFMTKRITLNVDLRNEGFLFTLHPHNAEPRMTRSARLDAVLSLLALSSSQLAGSFPPRSV